MTIEELYQEAKEQGMENAELYYKNPQKTNMWGEEERPFVFTTVFDKAKNQVRI